MPGRTAATVERQPLSGSGSSPKGGIGVNDHRGSSSLMTFAKDPASRDHREPSRSLVACGKESARYYAKVISSHPPERPPLVGLEVMVVVAQQGKVARKSLT